MKKKHDLQPYWDLILATTQADVLDTAIVQGLLAPLTTPQNATDLAQTLHLHPRNTAHVLETLWSMGLLIRNGHQPDWLYQLSTIGERYFNPYAEGYYGDTWRFRYHTLRQMGKGIKPALEANYHDAPPSNVSQAWAEGAKRQIATEQKMLTRHSAREIINTLPNVSTMKRFLDLGCGPGFIAIEIAKTYPQMMGTLFDFEATLAIAKDNIDTAQLSNRITFLSGDLNHDGIGEDYDLIWCASVFHFMQDPQATLDKIHSALKIGGIFISAHAEVADSAEIAAKTTPYYLGMQLRGCHVDSAGGMADAMITAGFEIIPHQLDLPFPLTPLTVVIGEKKQ